MTLRRRLFHRHEDRRWDLPVQVGRLTLRNPVIASSGTYGYGLEYERYGDPRCLGAVVVKSLTVDPRPGFVPPRVALLQEPGSMVNAVGVPNPGVSAWATEILPRMLERQVPVVASVWGVDPEGVVRAAELLAQHGGPIAWEINLSCPNSDHGGPPVSHDPNAAADICSVVRALAPESVGIWAKLSPDAPDVTEVGVACHAAGADAVTVSNTYPAASAELVRPPHLGKGAGGMSGAVLRHYVRPLVEKFTSTHPEVPVLACGGVLSSEIAVDYLDLGAKAVQVGTASLYDPRACHRIALGTIERMRARQ